MELIGAIFIVFISILTVVYAYFKYAFDYWKSRDIPCDKPSIPYGNIKGFGSTIQIGQFTQNLYNKYKSSGAKLCGAYFFIRPVAILLDLQLIKSVLMKDFANFNERGSYCTIAIFKTYANVLITIRFNI